MIKTVIFDIGNVLLNFMWEDFFRKFCPDDETFRALADATIRTPEWHELDRGILGTGEIIDSFIRNAPDQKELILRVFQNLNGILVPFPYTVPWIQELKQNGYRVLVLSNFSEKMHTDCNDVMGFLEYTDGGILSYREKLIKPDPAIYKLLLNRYHLIPEECVFLDDLSANVAAAEKLGIHGIQFTGKEDAGKHLEKLGVRI